MDATTATLSYDDLDLELLDPEPESLRACPPEFDPDATATFPVSDEPTEQMEALTVEQTLFDEPMPLPPTSYGDPAYFVEVRRPRGTASLLAVRNTLDEALFVAGSVHPSVADVLIRELPLPCQPEALLHAAMMARTWAREPNGRWVPALPPG